MAAGAPEVMNGGVRVFAIRTGGNSALGFISTSDPTAKILYAINVGFATVVCSGQDYISQTCQFNRKGALTSASARTFYDLANQANEAAALKSQRRTVRRPLNFRNPQNRNLA